MIENREYEKMLAIACEYAERVGSMDEALQLLELNGELAELLKHDWEQQTEIGTAVQPVYELSLIHICGIGSWTKCFFCSGRRMKDSAGAKIHIKRSVPRHFRCL